MQESLTDLEASSLRAAVANLSAQIRDLSDPFLHEALLCDFSTTTPEIKTASEIVLLDSYTSFYSFRFRLICGIPSITLTGSTEDWQRIRDRFELLATYDLEWWAARMRPILQEFVNTSEGRCHPGFWKAIYNPRETYGRQTVTGWVADLFPYLGDAPKRRRNNVFEHPRLDWLITENKSQTGKTARGGLHPDPEAEKGASGFPTGLARVPVDVSLPGAANAKLDLLGGFLAVEQMPDSALAPVIGWCVSNCR